jgi:hypothetical protein
MIFAPAFFGGDASDLGHVRQLPQATFRALVDEVLNMAVPLNVTRAQYAAMDKATRQRAKRVPYVVPCTFAQSPSPRLLELAQVVTLLCLDVDDAHQAAPFVSSPETVAGQLAPFNFAVHTTASSTPTAPRVRVLVEAAGLPLDCYTAALLDIARRLGLPAITRESRVVVQPMYLPTLFKGDEGHPLVWATTDGRAYAAADLTAMDMLYGDVPTTPTPDASGTDDDLDFLRTVVDEVTLADAASALAALDPDCAYGEWLDVAAALRHQFPNDPDADRAYALFDEWSSGGQKYVGPEDTAAKWRSLRPQPRGRAPVTIRSVLARAKAAGWNSGTTQERLFASVRDRIRAYPDLSIERLMHEGIDWIAATPLLTKSEEEALLQEVIRRLRQEDIKASLASLRKDLRAHKQRASQQKEHKERVPTWAKGMCYVGHVNQFFRPATGEQLSPEALDRAYGNRLLPSEEQLKEAGDASLNTRSRPVVAPQDYLLNHVQVPVVYDYLYDPSQPNDAFLHQDGKAYANTYVRNYPEPAPEEAAEAGRLFQAHLDLLIEDAGYRATLLHWIAHVVQRPGVKIRWAVLLQGAEGCGKTFFAEALAAVLGPGHVRPIDGNALCGQWNDWAYGAQVVALEEVRVAGQNRHEVMNTLKPLITNSPVNVNQRFRDSRSVPNHTNYILFTNHHDALPVTGNDRRYFVLKARFQARDQVELLGPGYFTPLFAMLRDLPAGLRSWLESVPIPDDFPTDGPAPLTCFMQQLVQDSASDPLAIMRELIAEGDNPLVKPDVLSSAVLLQMMEGRSSTRISGQYVASLLRDEGYEHLGRVTLGGHKHHAWAPVGSSVGAGALLATLQERAAEADPEAAQELGV